MNFSKAFGCGRITPSCEDGTAEENFMRGLEAVQKHGDNVDWKDVAKCYLRAANEVSSASLLIPVLLLLLLLPSSSSATGVCVR